MLAAGSETRRTGPVLQAVSTAAKATRAAMAKCFMWQVLRNNLPREYYGHPRRPGAAPASLQPQLDAQAADVARFAFQIRAQQRVGVEPVAVHVQAQDPAAGGKRGQRHRHVFAG